MKIGDYVTVAVPGAWLGHTGNVTARRWFGFRRRYQVGSSGWYYASQLLPGSDFELPL